MPFPADPLSPYALAPGEGEAASWLSEIFRLKASTAALGITELAMGSGNEPPMHVHRH
jgi:hypothetical protein